MVGTLLDTIDAHKKTIADQASTIDTLDQENEKLLAGNAKLAARIQEINTGLQHHALNSAVFNLL